MGSGSSKEKPQQSSRETTKSKPVANVNNRGGGDPATTNSNTNNTLSLEPEPQNRTTFITQPDDSAYNQRNNRVHDNRQDEDPNANQTRGRPQERGNTNRGVWKADRETEDELNEVLQIPTTHHTRQTTNRSDYSVSPGRQEDLPETYAQRKQREQYTLNRQMLLREKTIYRNPDDWKNEEEEENEGKGGFDPNRFRSANKGQPVKSTVFTTSNRQDGGLQYMSGHQSMDEFDVAPRHTDTPRNLPVYNQSEQDLMASLEKELL